MGKSLQSPINPPPPNPCFCRLQSGASPRQTDAALAKTPGTRGVGQDAETRALDRGQRGRSSTPGSFPSHGFPLASFLTFLYEIRESRHASATSPLPPAQDALTQSYMEPVSSAWPGLLELIQARPPPSEDETCGPQRLPGNRGCSEISRALRVVACEELWLWDSD